MSKRLIQYRLPESLYSVQVPLWDMLNHVTGKCNVRLHHSQKQGVLQMIATQPIKQGEELINNYGPLSDAELLRRFGFTEHEANPHNGCEIPFALVTAQCSQQPQAAMQQTTSMDKSAARSTTTSSTPAQETNAMINSDKELMQCKMAFMLRHTLIPNDGWFKIGSNDKSSLELVETVRLLLLPRLAFTDFEREVERWRCPLARPLAHLSHVSSMIKQILQTMVSERLAGLAMLESGDANAQETLKQKAARNIVRTEQLALIKLQAWLHELDNFSIIDACKQVWTHVR